ncbi:MAG TPA: CPBP family intramembrane glutamic endopeptidase [Acidimicrobiales bacterium]|nr:CPBP family intramembrane glutamic endopeptidase [Acidimicrobiales bacterium]
MSREAAIVGAARRFGWSDAETPGAQVAVCAASVAVVVEAASYLTGMPGQLFIGGLPVSPSLVPLTIAGIACGRRAFGSPRSPAAAHVFWAVCSLSLLVGGISLSVGRAPTAVLSLLLTGFVEEFMYRGAIPALAAFTLARGGMGARRAGVLGLVIGGACFVVLPGHVAQWDAPSDALPFVAFACLAALAVWRTGALLEVTVLHAVFNTLNISRIDGTSGSAGGIMLAALFAVLVIAYIPSSRETDLVIDLTGPEPQVRGPHQLPVPVALAD